MQGYPVSMQVYLVSMDGYLVSMQGYHASMHGEASIATQNKSRARFLMNQKIIFTREEFILMGSNTYSFGLCMCCIDVHGLCWCVCACVLC